VLLVNDRMMNDEIENEV